MSTKPGKKERIVSGRLIKAVLVAVLLLAASALLPAASFAAITPSILTYGFATNSTTSYTTGSFTIKPKTLVLVFINSHLPGKPGIPTLSGHGLTWERITSIEWKTTTSDDSISVYRAVGASQTTGSVTMTYTLNQNEVLWTVMQFERADITPFGVVQSAVQGSENILSMTINLAPLKTSANALVGCFANDSDKGIQPGTGFGSSPVVVGSGPNRDFMVEWRLPGSSTDTTVNATFAETKAAAGIALEVGVGVITTLGNGSDPGPAAIGPGGAATLVDAFTLVTDRETATISDFTVTLAAGTSAAIGLIEILNEAGSVIGSAPNPANDTPKVTLTTPITVSTTQSAYQIRITPKGHAAMPAPAGSMYSVTARVTDWTDYSNHEGVDSGSATVSIDNLSPANVTGAAATPGDAEATINWTNPADTDLGSIVVLRRAGTAVTDTPVEGESYAAGDSVGSASAVACVASSPGTTCTAANLTNATAYYFKIFTRDTSGNYSLNGVSTPVSVTPQHYQADALIKLSGEADTAYLKDDVYETAPAAQVKPQGVVTGSTASYSLRFQNDGSTNDKIVVSGTGSGSNFTVQYLDATLADQTAAVVGSGYTTAYLAPGAYQDWTLRVTPKAGATPVPGGTTFEVLANAKSWTNSVKADQVKAVTTSTSANITLVKSADKTSCKAGEDITYTITASNGANLSAAKNVEVNDAIPTYTGFKVGSATFNPGTSTLTCDVAYFYQNWSYTPVSGGCGAPAGYDYCVAQVKWVMNTSTSMPTATAFSVSMTVKVK